LIGARFEGLIFFIVSLDELIAVFKLFPARKMSSGGRRKIVHSFSIKIPQKALDLGLCFFNFFHFLFLITF
jgi:hypothetical protein